MKKLFTLFWLISCTHTQIEYINTELQNPWQKVVYPITQQNSESIGEHANGCLVGAKSLFPQGDGYQVMRLSRGRFWAHQHLVNFLQDLSLQVKKHNLPPLLIGDMSMPRGGVFTKGHTSHQSGLDVDIWYSTHPMASKRPLSLEEREITGAAEVVDLNTYQLNSFWDNKINSVLKITSRDERVNRIFVHPVIKKQLCEKYPQNKWHTKIRSWYGHHDHFHVRLNCPIEDKRCKSQPNIQNLGCGEELDWWFSDEARGLGEYAKTSEIKSLQEQQKTLNTKLNSLPSDCMTVLQTP